MYICMNVSVRDDQLLITKNDYKRNSVKNVMINLNLKVAK